MSETSQKSKGGKQQPPDDASTELEFFDQLAWAIPTAFASALAAYRFEPGDVLYPEAAAYGALETKLPGSARAIQVRRSSRSTRSAAAEAGSSRRRSGWESEVEIERLDLAKGSSEVHVVSQGKLLMTLWHGDESWLDPERPEPPLPRSGRELAGQLDQAGAAFDARPPTQRGCRFLFVVDLASDASRVKAAAIEEALAALGAVERIDLPPQQTGVEEAATYHPALVVRALWVPGASVEGMEEALRGALYGGGAAAHAGEAEASDEDGEGASKDRFSVARHGLLESIEP